MSFEWIADALEISRRTLCRTFVRELAIGRSKKMLENIKRIDAAAKAGNVSAMKYFHALMLHRRSPGEDVGEDKWAAVANQIEADMEAEANNPNLPKNSEFWKKQLMAKPKRDLRPMHRAAKAGDHDAARAVLKIYGFSEIAAEIKPGRPFSTRVRNAVGAISGSVDTEWEKDLLHDPPPRRSKAPRVELFDD